MESLLKAMACERAGGERTVTELQRSVGIAMSAAPQHLAKLREAEIVTTRRESQTIHYSFANDAAMEMLGSLHGVFCSSAAPRKVKWRKAS